MIRRFFYFISSTHHTVSYTHLDVYKRQVVQISSLDDADSNSIEFERLTTLSKNPTALEKAQADLQSDPALVQALASKNVQLNNVVEVQTAADGGKIVYVK